MDFSVIIPARYASSRLPGKPLRCIKGKPLVQHVFECAQQSGARQIIIATDDERIAQTAHGFGAQVCMTSVDHPSGTARLAEVIAKLAIDDSEILVNLQGDEPLVPARIIGQVAANLYQQREANIATLCVPIHDTAELFNRNVCKVVMDKQGYALYFSRAPIPWHRDSFTNAPDAMPAAIGYYRHVGLYAYRASFIKEYVTWPACELELAESLEQLRVLWNGKKIHVAEAMQSPGPGVDTEEDLARVEQLLA